MVGFASPDEHGEETTLTKPAAMVDPRQPRLGQAITGMILLGGFVLDAPIVLPALALVLAAASLGGAALNPYVWLFRALRRVGTFAPPAELEEAAPPRFANTLGFVFLAGAAIARYALGAEGLAWALGILVSGLALLAAVTGLCVGCELYVWVRRLVTRGRVRDRITRPVEEVAG